MLKFRVLSLGLLFLLSSVGQLNGQAPPSEAEARAALRKAAMFFHGKVAVQGGYVYRYSEDLKKREGEGVAGADVVWVQAPGTPSVGMAFLEAYQRTGEEYCLKAARDAAKCLLAGQLRSGGWQDSIEFSSAERRKWAYRTEPERKKARNPSTLDDDKTQSVLRFLMRLDAQENFKDAALHEAVMFALDALLSAQHPCGAWAQVWTEPVGNVTPILKATIPKGWQREYPGGDYWLQYTLNDGAMLDAIEVCLLAYDIYGEERFFAAAKKGGEFLLLAQLPEPQPAWAQQYDFEMRPAWARKFEPPAVSGGESQLAMRTLILLYERTGDRRYLEPIPRAIAYLRRSLLPEGKLARFYELNTNKPLYATPAPEFAITYDSSKIRPGYSFKVESRLDAIEREFGRAEKSEPPRTGARRSIERANLKMSSSLAAGANEAISQLDERGAWVEEGRLSHFGKGDATGRIISSSTFCRRLVALANYIAAMRVK